MDMAFLTNDAAPFFDYGIAVLSVVPEPSGLVVVTAAVLSFGVLRGLARITYLFPALGRMV